MIHTFRLNTQNISAEQKKLLDAGKTTGISETTVATYKEARKNIEEATAALKAYDSYDKQGKEATRSMSKEQREKEKANAVKAEAAKEGNNPLQRQKANLN